MNIEAIVIKKVPLREHDQLVVLYSRELGKCSAIAKGSLRAHSKQALALDEGNRMHCELVPGRSGFIMTGAQALRAYADAKRSLVRWSAMQFFLQAIDLLVFDEQAESALWSCLCAACEQVNTASDDDMPSVFHMHQRALLSVLGYGACPEPMLDATFENVAQRKFLTLQLFRGVVSGRNS